MSNQKKSSCEFNLKSGLHPEDSRSKQLKISQDFEQKTETLNASVSSIDTRAHYDFASENEQFPKYFAFPDLLNKEELSHLINALNLDNQNFEKSQVFNVEKNENVY